MHSFVFAICILLSVWSCHSLRIGTVPTEVTSANKTAHIYVINLDVRKDRCKCMQHQLQESPFKIFRHEASTPETLKDCPSVVGSLAKDMTASAKAIFCSNQKVYERVNQTKPEEQPDFVIIMEDDIKIKTSPPDRFWGLLSTFLNGDCAMGSWDILAVDTFAQDDYTPSVGGRMSCASRSGHRFDVHETTLPMVAHGAHLLIIKKQAIPQLLTQEMHLQDKFSHFRRAGLKVNFWLPQMVRQLSKGNRDKNSVCDSSVRKSDNPLHLHSQERKSDISFAKGKMVTHELECPHQD